MQQEIDWELLYNSLHPRLLQYFQARLSSTQQAEDFAAMTFSRAWRNRDQYQPDRAAPETWIFAIARHLLIDYLRRRQPVSISIDTIIIEAEDRVEHEIELREELDRLGAVLSYLNSRETRILTLRYGQQLRTREIARITGLTEANITKIISRTLLKLRRVWELAPTSNLLADDHYPISTVAS